MKRAAWQCVQDEGRDARDQKMPATLWLMKEQLTIPAGTAVVVAEMAAAAAAAAAPTIAEAAQQWKRRLQQR